VLIITKNLCKRLCGQQTAVKSVSTLVAKQHYNFACNHLFSIVRAILFKVYTTHNVSGHVKLNVLIGVLLLSHETEEISVLNFIINEKMDHFSTGWNENGLLPSRNDNENNSFDKVSSISETERIKEDSVNTSSSGEREIKKEKREKTRQRRKQNYPVCCCFGDKQFLH